MQNSTSLSLKFSCKEFTSLSLQELYAIMQLRQEVFVVEQECLYVDADGKDPQAWHLIGRNERDKIVAYVRILPKGITYADYVSIGRVVTHQSIRGLGAGRILVEKAIENLERIFGAVSIKLSAQAYLLAFYQSLGFESVGPNYLEDGIPHIAMIKKQQHRER